MSCMIRLGNVSPGRRGSSVKAVMAVVCCGVLCCGVLCRTVPTVRTVL